MLLYETTRREAIETWRLKCEAFPTLELGEMKTNKEEFQLKKKNDTGRGGPRKSVFSK